MITYFENVENISIETIKSIITNEIEESIHLDFKESGALDKTDNKKKELSKDISAFANSDGGYILYGVKEYNHKASELSFINGNIITKEWLEQTINSNIQKKIEGLRIFPIRNQGKIEETVYLIEIPKSINAPHIAKDKRFYKRYNFESVAMEEYEIRELYGRKLKSKLIINGYRLIQLNNSDSTIEKDFSAITLEVDIYNDGDVIENEYKVNTYIETFEKSTRISWHPSLAHINYTRLEDNRIKVSAKGITPAYPNETINTIRFNIECNSNYLVAMLTDLKIELVLFYSNGEDKMEVDISNFRDKIKNRLLE